MTQVRQVQPSHRGALLLQSIVNAYYESSIVEAATRVQAYNESVENDKTFLQIGMRVAIPRSDMEKTDRVLLVDEIGVSVATGERNYLRDIWLKNLEVEKHPAHEFTATSFRHIIHKLSSGINPTIMFAPIDKYVEVASWIHAGEPIIRWSPSHGANFVLEDGRELKIVWSNKYAPLDCFILVDRSATHWTFKPDSSSGGRLTAIYVENEKDIGKVDFYVKTVVNADVINRTGVRLFSFG